MKIIHPREARVRELHQANRSPNRSDYFYAPFVVDYSCSKQTTSAISDQELCAIAVALKKSLIDLSQAPASAWLLRSRNLAVNQRL